ncbi:2-dehydro-3-deoxy-D-gluconate 5-dehydrogenase KduD [Alicyclobacillus fastidiosus]|uniref:2-dehydro-3-deoxy-D-gluconate 5-dehydrogenase KduD n=1 Tax=Alicyclobacillus fastidiosus TaxID=392011 RepID=A0ABY6ZPT0_9BACL|nr:2-dehydro-3-deoxy-D-gluconate 5-dehydrogenase KduD [Alicyclobacillus fastidiosus]WAH43940.1 2-dehydro-3-deoxy-D-gluconate 5-dehydrogenase KduD [Alicyclobacillus fastidiosus]GMA60195.1 2-deoxy-D-gluconate 3-dehydrogenase [Alicyclobacillus fastidiosus]
MNEVHCNHPNIFGLQGKVALVTGVSRGLGQGMAIGLAEAGADVIGIGLNDMSYTGKVISQYGSRFHEITADLTMPSKAADAAKQAIDVYGRVDILVNNSGIIHRASAVEYSDDDWNRVLNVNLHSAFQLCRAIGEHMIARGSGKIINIASMLSFQGGLNVAAYTASKHAIAGLTKSLANEWGQFGICVNAIAPGYMATDNTLPLRNNSVRADAILSRIPKHRWGTPDDLKGPVIFLSSDLSDYVNGHVLCVDGGWMSS